MDPYFNALIGNSLGAAFGVAPGTRQVMPGPISHLTGQLQWDMLQGGRPDLAGVFPYPTYLNQGGFNGGFGPQFNNFGFPQQMFAPMLNGMQFGRF